GVGAVLRPFGPLFLRVLGAIAAVLVHVLAVILPVLARVFPRVVIVVPAAAVHVAAAVPAVRTVVVVVVHGRADRDAGGEADEPCRNRGVGVRLFLHDDRVGRVDGL